MPRFPIKQNQIKNRQALISGPDYRHIVKVLRLKTGSEITLFDEIGMEHIGVITGVETKEIKVAIAESKKVETESSLNITLLQGVPKGDKMDFIVEKATELGVKTIVPIITERSQMREPKRVQRWQRIAIESSKQCGRMIPPEIYEPKSFQEIMKYNYYNKLQIILYEKCKDKLKHMITNDSKPIVDIVLSIGPEGGFTEKEVIEAKEKGFIPVGLGPRIFRTETASIVAIAVLQHIYGDI
jgi:16S rRNA (uracil1498-N3)-methyltransferase